MRQITAQEAAAFFAHPTQQLGGISPDHLPDEGFSYWAAGPVCGVFHAAPWPGVLMAHYGVKPAFWGHLIGPARAVLEAVWAAESPARIIGWTPESNRAALAFSRRLGFVEDGRMAVGGETIIMQGWTP